MTISEIKEIECCLRTSISSCINNMPDEGVLNLVKNNDNLNQTFFNKMKKRIWLFYHKYF